MPGIAGSAAAPVRWGTGPKVCRTAAPGRAAGLVACGAVGVLLAGGAAQADEWSLTPRLATSVEYDDNKTLRARDPISATGVVVDAGAALGWATETSSLVLTPRVRSGRYDKETELLNDDNLYLDLASSTATERTRYALSGNLTLDSVDSSQTIAEEEGLSRRVVQRRVSIDRDRRSLAPSWSYALTERDRASLSATLSWVDYDQGSVLQTGYVDYRYHVVNASLGHAFTERDTVSGIVYYSRYARDLRNAVTDSIGLQVGYEHAFTETLKGSLAVGGVRSEFSSDPLFGLTVTPAGQLALVPIDTDSTQYGQLINGSLSQKLELDQWSLGLSRTLSPTGEGVLVSRDEVRADYRRKLSERMTGTVAALAYRDEAPRTVGQAVRPDREYARIELGLDYRLTPYWTLRSQYRYRYQRYDTVSADDDTADSNAFWVSLAWQGEKQAISR